MEYSLRVGNLETDSGASLALEALPQDDNGLTGRYTACVLGAVVVGLTVAKPGLGSARIWIEALLAARCFSVLWFTNRTLCRRLRTFLVLAATLFC